MCSLCGYMDILFFQYYTVMYQILHFYYNHVAAHMLAEWRLGSKYEVEGPTLWKIRIIVS